MMGILSRLLGDRTRHIVIPCEEYDRDDFIRGAERLATLFLERARLARSIGAEREMLEFATDRARKGERSLLDYRNDGLTHYEWLKRDSEATLRDRWGSLRAIDSEMSEIASSLDPGDDPYHNDTNGD